MPKTRRSASLSLFRFDYDLPGSIRRFRSPLPEAVPVDSAGSWKAPHFGDADSPRPQPSLKTLPDSAQEKFPGWGKEERKAHHVCEDPWREEEGASQEDGKPIEEGAPRKSTLSQLAPDLPNGS